MRGQRVLVSGMGGELGSRVASLLEAEPWVGRLVGIDVDPPRRRLRRSEFHLIEPADRGRMHDVITGLDPHVMIHLAVWEPDARAGTRQARQLTSDAAESMLNAAAECRSLRAVVVRSGIEIYGRRRGGDTAPNEDSPVDPSSEYGRMLGNVEAAAAALGRRRGIAVSALRLAPVLGPHIPSPLGRVLRHPIVPCSLLGNAAFSVALDADAAVAFVAAAKQRADGPLNVVADGEITLMQAICRGRRVPLPLIGPQWPIARHISHMFGAPIPDHVMELIHHGRVADGTRLQTMLGVTPRVATPDVIDRLFNWEGVIRIPSSAQAA